MDHAGWRKSSVYAPAVSDVHVDVNLWEVVKRVSKGGGQEMVIILTGAAGLPFAFRYLDSYG